MRPMDSPGSEDRRSKQAVTSVPESRVVPRPIPEEQIRDPRGFELNQLRRRYNPKETPLPYHGIAFMFKFPPSDPDFPFELDYLHCELRVPGTYPDRDVEGPPILTVKNATMPRGFAINIERGWDTIVQERRDITLAQMVRSLDNQLESLLSAQKAETVKMVQFKDSRHLNSAGDNDTRKVSEKRPGEKRDEQSKPKLQPKTQLPPLPRQIFTRDQIAEAKARRAIETKQLEARMGRSLGYRREADGVVYTLPFEARGRAPPPAGLKGVTKIHLIIPLLYPLQALRVQLADALDGQLAEEVEDLFSEKTKDLPKMNLMGLVNWLASNLGLLANEVADREKKLAMEKAEQELARATIGDTRKGKEKAPEDDTTKGQDVDGRGYIKVIPRPPEWTFGYHSAESTESTDSEDHSDDGDEGYYGTDGENGKIGVSNGTEDMNAEKGTSLSFPSLALHEVELLSISSLAIRIRCARCKTINDITGLQHIVEKSICCSKCSLELTVTFRQQLMHQNNNRAGFVDVVGGSVIDMLPSTFIPVCAQCSNECQPITLAKDTVTNICRSCHTRFSISITGLKLQVLTAPQSSTSTSRRSRDTRSLPSWQPGQELPDRGTCQHYRRSFRWFRFNCCRHVHPCDHCHDEAEDHVHEWADRMVCGFCGREGRYAPNTCGYCGRGVIGGKGKGFWEGGRGTRDKVKMNKKERRKFKRVGGGEMEKEREKRKLGL